MIVAGRLKMSDLAKLLKLLGLVGITILVYGGFRFWQYGEELNAEYKTAWVIRDVTKFVESHKGQWPRNWNELGDGDYSEYVKMDFDVSEEELLTDPDRIHSAIVPVTGKYHTYPHATRQLNELRDVLVKYHQPAEQSPLRLESLEPSQ